MAKCVCMAVKNGEVKRRGKASVEWHKDGVPQYYCYGYVNKMYDEPLETCKHCISHVDTAQDDLDVWLESKKNS